jgi:hypothetical protein
VLFELGAGGSNPISTEATLLAVFEMGAWESTSSLTWPPEARLAAFAFPKLSFHFDGFLLGVAAGALTGGIGIGGTESGEVAEGCTKGLAGVSK